MSRKSILFIFLFALILRLTLWVFVVHHPERALDNDSRLYLKLGETLLDSHTFPNILRTPGYPFFIASLYAVFGKFPQAVLFSQALLDSVTAVIIALLFLKIFQNTRYAFGAGVIYSVNPFAIFYANMLLTETLFSFFFVSAVSLFLFFLQGEGKIKLAFSSVLLGIGTLCRPISFFVPLLLVPFIFFTERKLTEKLISCILFILLYGLVLLPWYVRNDHVYGQWTLSTATKYNIFVVFAPEVLMGKDNLFSLIAINVNELVKPYQAQMWQIAKLKYGDSSEIHHSFDDPVRAHVLTEEGLKVIRNDPLIFTLSHMVGIGRVMTPSSPRFYRFMKKDMKALSLLSFAIDFITMSFCIIGIFLFLRERSTGKIQTIVIISMIVLIAFFSFIPGIEGGTRFRVPLLPYVIILSIFGMQKIVTHIGSRTGRFRS